MGSTWRTSLKRARRALAVKRPVRLRAARNMPPAISTIVMSRLFARRQRASMSAYFTNSLTAPACLGLLAWPHGRDHLDRAARGSVAPRKMACRPVAGDGLNSRSKAIDLREGGQPGRCPFPIGSGNGRQDARCCFARRPIALLRRLRLKLWSLYFGFGLFCARCSCRSRHSREVLALTWTS